MAVKKLAYGFSRRYPEIDLEHDLVGLGVVTVNRKRNAHNSSKISLERIC